MSEIPSVDLRDYLSEDPKKKERFVKDLGGAFENIGFVALSGHLLSEELVSDLYSEVKLLLGRNTPRDAKKAILRSFGILGSM